MTIFLPIKVKNLVNDNFLKLLKDIFYYIFIMTKIQLVKDFNTQLLDLMKEFVLLTNDKDLQAYEYLLKELLKKNCMLPIENFKAHVLPYKQKIYEQDEEYFLKNDDYIKNVQNDDDSLLKALKLKEIYKMLNKDGKQNLWNFLKVLCYYAESY